jgi:hypothetical protein
MNYRDLLSVKNTEAFNVTLDGEIIKIPAGRRSLRSIHSYLETLALAKQHILSSLAVDGQSANLALPLVADGNFCQIDAVSIPLGELPLLILTTAQQQAGRTHEMIESAITLVLINSPDAARELWWNIASQLKEPVLTLSLMPDDVCQRNNGISFGKLRQWQLEQIASIVREVDAVGDSDDTLKISDALENRVLPWLQKLSDMIQLWHDAAMAGARLGIKYGAA